MATTPVAPPSTQAVIGRRIGAALLDIIVLAAAFVGVAALLGDVSTSNSSFSISLHGGGALLYFLLVYAYYFAGEAFWNGQTLGKRMVGVRVVRLDGTAPSAGQIAARTILRVIDGLPVLYLVGFVTVLATGPRAQRVGDLAAGTFVVSA
jgi:uncharacterized RDD family membrane protein YckC